MKIPTARAIRRSDALWDAVYKRNSHRIYRDQFRVIAATRRLVMGLPGSFHVRDHFERRPLDVTFML